MSPNISVQTIAQMLRSDAENIARRLLPNGRYEGAGEYRCSGSNSPTGDAISVHVGKGPKQGVVGFWNGTKRGGDILDLIEVVNGCSKESAIEWAKSYLGFGHSRTWLTEWKVREQDNNTAEVRAERTASDRRNRLSRASGVWKSAGALAGPALIYLRTRGISNHIREESLRYHTGLPHPEGGSFPAIVCRVVDREGLTSGIWRIFLKPDGSGKAPVENAKLGLGESTGCAVRIGGEGKEIGIAEGIETALACRELLIRDPDNEPIPVWSVLSTAGIISFKVPKEVTRVRIFADADKAKFNKLGKLCKSPGLEAAEKLKERLKSEGIKCTIVTPPEGMDWLDVLVKSKGKK